MTRRDKTIGYNRTVKLRWLDETVDLFSVGQSADEILQTLRERLRDQLSIGSNAKRGSREKTITILLKTWVRVPARVRDLRDEALQIIQRMDRTERLPLHWGMTMAVYPFWRTVADVTGRLLRIQGTAATHQVQRRVRELLGEREAVSRSTRYVLRAFQDWGVIIAAEQRGFYTPNRVIPIEDPTLTTWLVEAVLLTSDNETTDLQVLLHAPALFPFQLKRLRPEALTKSGRLTVMRHGTEDDLVMLRKSPSTR